MAVTTAIILPMSIMDIRERQIYTDLMWIAVSISCCFLFYDIFYLEIYQEEYFALYVVGILMAVISWVGAKLGVIGMGDAATIWIIATMVPQINDTPTSGMVIIMALVLSILYHTTHAAFRNISDILNHKRYSKDIIVSYYKRKGEKFCIKYGRMQVGKVIDGIIKDKDGNDLMVSQDSHDIRVVKSTPLVAYLAISFVVVSAFMIPSIFL